jgi:CHAD domain-containing protein
MPVDMEKTASRDAAADVAAWHRAKMPVLARAATTEQALAHIVVAGITHLRANEACVLARAHEEGIHQMRVAVRRLRSCLSLFAELVPPDQGNYLAGELRWLIGELGGARDWDVLLSATLPPVMAQMPGDRCLEALRHEAEAARDAAYDRAAAAIGSPRYFGLVMLLGATVAGGRWHGTGGGDANPAWTRPAVAAANVLLERGYEQVRAAGENFAELDPPARHKLRIQVKKLRYAGEFFGSLYPRTGRQTYLTALKMLQDHLGTNNDVEVARQILRRLAREAKAGDRRRLAYGAGLVVGWHNHVSDHREERVGSIWSRFLARKPFWARPQPAADPAGTTAAVLAPAGSGAAPPNAGGTPLAAAASGRS